MATIDKYQPGPPPYGVSPEVRRYLDDELQRIAQRINSGILYLDVLSAEPARPVGGMLVYADGSNWNPGSGPGYYAYVGGAWQKL